MAVTTLFIDMAGGIFISHVQVSVHSQACVKQLFLSKTCLCF